MQEMTISRCLTSSNSVGILVRGLYQFNACAIDKLASSTFCHDEQNISGLISYLSVLAIIVGLDSEPLIPRSGPFPGFYHTTRTNSSKEGGRDELISCRCGSWFVQE